VNDGHELGLEEWPGRSRGERWRSSAVGGASGGGAVVWSGGVLLWMVMVTA
jgi:hypothetical protein